jgi:hypothetical protein
MKWWDTIRRSATQDWHFGPIPAERAPAGGERVPIQAGQHYVSAHLSSMRLSHVRVGTKRLYASVTSSFTLDSSAGGRAELMCVTTPSKLRDVEAASLDHFVTMDKRVLGPVPYRGGDLGVELGLFAVPAADLLQPYLTLVEDVTKFIGVSFLDAVPGLLPSAKNALDLLFGAANDPTLEIGYSGDLQQPSTGYYCAVRAPRNDPGLAGLRVAEDKRLVRADGTAVTEPYLVFQISASTQRDNWFSIPNLTTRWKELAAAYEIGAFDVVDIALKGFQRATRVSPDLLLPDATRINALALALLQHQLPGTTTSAGPEQPGLPPLSSLPLYDE